MDKKSLKRVHAFIAAAPWRFAKSVPQWPHWYVMEDWVDKREYNFFADFIDEYGRDDPWSERVTYRFLAVDGFKYWYIDEMLNRARPISNKKVRANGVAWLKRHNCRQGPYGVPILRGRCPIKGCKYHRKRSRG